MVVSDRTKGCCSIDLNEPHHPHHDQLLNLTHTTHRLLGGRLRVGLRLGVRQGLDCRPQLIDERIAVANLLSLFDTGQSVPQRQQPLGAERGAARNSSFDATVISPSLTCRRHLAAQRDPVTANDIDAHEWVLLIDSAAVPP
jgi:hypothetical protein